MRISSRRLTTVAVGSLATVGIIAAPAVADPGTTTPDSRTFIEDDPCDPSKEHEVTLEFEYSVHSHTNNTVVRSTTRATSTSGYVGTGHQTSVFGPKVVKQGVVFMSVNEDGDRYRVNQRIITSPNGLVVESLDVVCLRSR